MVSTVLGLSGHARSGKSTVATYLRKQYGAIVFTNSQPIGQMLKVLNWSHNRQSYATLCTALFDAFGRDLLAHHWTRLIDHYPHRELFVVDGIRYIEELTVYRTMANFHLLGIICSDEHRYERTKGTKDADKDTYESLNAFLKTKHIINESFVDEIVELADIHVVNEGSKEDLHFQISSVLKDL